MHRIIWLSVILHYVHYFHLNKKNLINIQGYVGLWMLYLWITYAFLITIMAWSVFKKSRIKSKILITEGLGENKISIYETYKNTVMSHRRHIYAKTHNMSKEKMYEYLKSDHASLHWKCVMWFCARCLSFNIPEQETDDQYTNTSTSIRFQSYHLIENCSTHARLLLT